MRKTTLVLLFNDKNQILLAMKKRGHWAEKWNWFGGKQAPDETILQTAVRELEEESGIAIEENMLQECGLLHFIFDEKPELSSDCHIFKAQYNWSFQETEEMAPKRRDIGNIPYDEMREDDKVWFEELFSNRRFDISKHCN